MKTIEVNPLTSSLWMQLIDECQSDVFHSPRWLEVLVTTYNFTARAILLVNEENRPLAGIPYIKINDMFSPRIVSLPFSDYCDPIVKDMSQWTTLTNILISEKSPLTVRCLHTTVPLEDSRFELINRANWHGLDLTEDLETIFNNIHSSSRRAIRKAKKDGVSVRIASEESDLRAFFELHLKIRKDKYRLLAQSFCFLENIWRNFIVPGQGALMLTELENKIIGGVFYLKWKDRLYYKFNASLSDTQSMRPNDLLMWEGIKYAKEMGLNFLDLGLSDSGQDGLIRYKQKYATDQKTISFLRLTPEGGVSKRDTQIRNLLPQLTDLFTDESVPNEITEKAGNLLYRYFT
ncbi:MAG: GNAT family N-acetyltransferase [Candidatus Scalindua sp. AMX11]|nr:MAG: GNAT family N-acetyltransferase [Candidatus Scalindua sp.]NOG83487.1 GNAT family N-acetyltransferase [Planctomycetota bacterium]RZV72898.1 MAG: GNAT family N-acetyltransferase [Candidatus Scalindua sp. SCAELEC01]TDE64805.1 MAG: GNAT family N-acetyltransferase [Candidatus Scalindua sp. AMX11]GJQ59814.1 MAG: hypothetical protein SCALA701_26150 [Candidatus Scalindua sp.]